MTDFSLYTIFNKSVFTFVAVIEICLSERSDGSAVMKKGTNGRQMEYGEIGAENQLKHAKYLMI